MEFKHPIYRVLAIYLVVAVASLAPIASMHQAARALGLKSVLVGGLVGGAALLALGALAGPAGVIGAAGCAGTGFLGTMGGVLGAAVSGITGICVATGTLALGALSTVGLLAGGAALAVFGLGLSPWIALPALALAAGLVVYAWNRNKYRYGAPYDQRYGRPFHDPFFDAGTRLANQSQSGAQVGSSGGFFDRFRSVFDRDRRNDSFFYNNRYVDGQGYIRQGNDFFGRMDAFFNGRNAGYAGHNSIYGTGGYGVLDPAGRLPTDRSGRVSGVGSTYSRTGFAPGAPDETAPVSEVDAADVADELAAAEAARKAAYERLIKAIKDNQQQQLPADVGTSSLQNEDVLQAISDYKAADRMVKEITGRLQPQEKQ